MKDLKTKYGPWAIVTGASSGIGKAFSEHLAKSGINVVAVARNKDNLVKLQSYMESKYAVKVKTIALDLSESNAAMRLGELTSELDVGLLINNAGLQNYGLFSENNAVDELKLVTLNVSSPMQLSHIFVKRFKQRGKGGILFTSSGFGYQGVPFFANYAASKAYLITLAEALNVELKPFDIDVTVISPGYTNTPMAYSAPIDWRKLRFPQQQPELVARIGLNALGRKATVVPGLVTKFSVWVNRLMPRSWPPRLLAILIGYARIGEYSNKDKFGTHSN
ncbi:MAG: short-chain dehydrogenase [Moraxellaceae bacterium]|nr:MAG: short-chain dehydrogenase [Moraxellaceae bacterium]